SGRCSASSSTAAGARRARETKSSRFRRSHRATPGARSSAAGALEEKAPGTDTGLRAAARDDDIWNRLADVLERVEAAHLETLARDGDDRVRHRERRFFNRLILCSSVRNNQIRVNQRTL